MAWLRKVREAKIVRLDVLIGRAGLSAGVLGVDCRLAMEPSVASTLRLCTLLSRSERSW
jgi:hypothetical protein